LGRVQAPITARPFTGKTKGDQRGVLYEGGAQSPKR
jgi:hypothetical protein